MSRLGYRSIEPLGGFSDKGRDAIHVSLSGKTSIMAYSVREDWRAKLAEDAGKINRHRHECDELVFITTSRFSAGERDEAVTTIRTDYGWKLNLFGLERLRVLLDNEFNDLKHVHPQIFPPQFLSASDSESTQSKKHVLVNYDKRDEQVATWLARKLTIAGFDVWCEDLPRLGTVVYPENIVSAMPASVSVVVALYSVNSAQNADLVHQRHIAMRIPNSREHGILLPVRIDDFNASVVDSTTRDLSFVDFVSSWSEGLKELIVRLDDRGVQQRHEDGSALALRTLLENSSSSGRPETVYSNCFSVLHVPSKMLRVTLGDGGVNTDKYLHWAYRRVSARTFLSFSLPPSEIVSSAEVVDVELESWHGQNTVSGINSIYLASELIRKSLYVHCRKRGMQYCLQSRLNYVPYGILNDRNIWSFRSPWGAKTRVQLVGQRKYWRKTGALYYSYFLSPHFVIRRDLDAEFVVVLNVRVRIATPDNVPLSPRTAQTRRKHLCKDWWNKQWLVRTCALADFLGEHEHISIEAYCGEKLIVSHVPYTLSASSGILEGGKEDVTE